MSNDPLIPDNPASGSDVVNEQAMYSAVMYLPLDDLDLPQEPAPTLKDILAASTKYANDPAHSAKDREIAASYVKTVNEMAGQLGIDTKNVTMNNPSWAPPKDPVYGDPEGLMGATFTTNGTTTMAFRGTPDRAWLDNAYSLSSPYGPGGDKANYYYTAPNGNRYGPMSEMDYATLKYAESVMANGGTYNTTGHSKGGHEAMLVTMVFGEQVGTCYSFDGYGVSAECYGNMAYYLGAEFDERRSQIIAINGDNDFVNGAGAPLAFGENTIYLRTETGGNPTYFHDIRGLITKGRLNEEAEQGVVSALFGFVDKVLGMDPNSRNNITLGIFLILQYGLTGEAPLGDPSGNKEAVVAAVVVLLVILVPALITLITTGVVAAILVLAATVLLVLAIFIGVVLLYSWLKSLFDGGRHTPVYALGAATLIKVETTVMDEYVTQLTALDGTIDHYITRAEALSQRGYAVGLHVPNGYSELIGLAQMALDAIRYLNKTKNALENAEKKVKSKVPST